MNPPVRAPLGAALALLLALAPLTGAAAPALVGGLVILLVVLVASGWPDLLELPSARGTRIVMIATGVLGAALAVLSPGRIGSMEGVAMMSALGIFASFGHQMVRRDRSALAASLTGTVAGVMLVAMAACWIPGQPAAAPTSLAAPIMTAGSLGLAAALLVLPLPVRAAIRAPIAILAAAGVTGLVLGGLVPGALPTGLVIGLLIGAGTCAAHLLLDAALVAREPLPSLTVAAAPVATIGVVILLAERVLG